MKLPKVGKPKKANSVLQLKTTGRKMQFAEINTAVGIPIGDYKSELFF